MSNNKSDFLRAGRLGCNLVVGSMAFGNCETWAICSGSEIIQAPSLFGLESLLPEAEVYRRRRCGESWFHPGWGDNYGWDMPLRSKLLQPKGEIKPLAKMQSLRPKPGKFQSCWSLHSNTEVRR